ncbi:DUF1013 domain-containing protein [Kordiimonas sp. SCSIO 12610]|uniref:DUF1013 domain-containing protein n=1 Tax=Kordiimonas sp. SCSIO 12610 TaxID=2829597 RepID=UPI00210E80C6|nr:cell cycle transcriptional regulator TrcR [Kordiimonas sp. SCSIO 12610]UTW55805.1 DUF1013 domain-containing protein [Kordiimonas sp. SCSIO 12610]
MNQPLMPMATAVWLVDNTALTFTQIAEFCGLHELEIQGIADGTIGMNIVGQDPTANEQLTWDDINKCQEDPKARLTLLKDAVEALPRTKGPRYTPVSKRQDKPDAIAWLVRNHPELSDLQISRLVGTTKPTIMAIRDKSHWNSQNIRPQDPVGLGLCKQYELDEAVQLAAEREAKKRAKGEVSDIPAAEPTYEAPVVVEDENSLPDNDGNLQE